MKKTFLLSVILLSFSYTSCKKESTCVCTDGTTHDIYDTKKNANKICDGYGYTNNNTLINPYSGYPYNYQPPVTCSIK